MGYQANTIAKKHITVEDIGYDTDSETASELSPRPSFKRALDQYFEELEEQLTN